jgi:hypothetical protein
MSGLGLVPNEIVGYRIKPDWYNFTVVVVKRFGSNSKKAGQEYEEALAYCRSLESASDWLIEHVTRVKAEQLQAEVLAAAEAQIAAKGAKVSLKVAEGSVANARALAEAIGLAKAEAHAAIADLTARLEAAGLDTSKKLTHFMGGELPEGDPAEAAIPV